jgi:Right handed beta helix region
LKTCLAASVIVLSALLVGGAPVSADIIRVPTQFNSFANAVGAAAEGDTIQIVGDGGATFPSTNVQIDKDLTIQGGWRIDFATRDPDLYVSVLRDTTGTRDRPVVRILGAVTVRMEGVHLVDGESGLIAEGGANLTLVDCVIRDQQHRYTGQPVIEEYGTGLRMVGGTLVAERTTFRNNRSDYGGAGVGLIGVNSAEFTDCRFEDPLSSAFTLDDKSGAAIHARDVPSLALTGSVFSRCRAVHRGGGIYALRSVVNVSDCDFLDGLGSGGGGAAYLDACPSATFIDCRFDRNDAVAGGALAGVDTELLSVSGGRMLQNVAFNNAGALSLDRTGFSISGTEFRENHIASEISDRGGAVFAFESSGTVTGSSFTDERAHGEGGAWSQIGGTTSFVDTRFEDCVAGAFGGAVQIEQGGLLQLTRCLLARCTAVFGGGVAASFTADVRLEHCTLTGGRGRSEGAAVYVDTGSTVELLDSIACCAASGDQIYCENATIVVDHSNAWNDDSINPRGEYGGECPDPTGAAGNLRADPMHCAADPDYALAAGSPCEGTASDGGDMGWRPAACTLPTPTGLEVRSWGRLKASYRSP